MYIQFEEKQEERTVSDSDEEIKMIYREGKEAINSRV